MRLRLGCLVGAWRLARSKMFADVSPYHDLPRPTKTSLAKGVDEMGQWTEKLAASKI